MNSDQIKVKSELIDLKLTEELERIDRDFEARGLVSSGARLRARGRAKIQSQLEKELLLSSESQQLKKRLYDYDYKTRTFQITHNDGQLVALTFDLHDNQISNQQILFEVGYELLGSGITSIPRAEILQRCTKKAKEYNLNFDISSYWLKQTLRNLRDRIKKSQVTSIVHVFDRENSGNYKFFLTPLQ